MAGINIVSEISANPYGYKEYDVNDPDFTKPRGRMFSFTTRGWSGSSIFDYNFAGNGTFYPNAANGYPNGKQLLWGGKTVSGEHGIYIAPGNNKVAYLTKVEIFFNHTSKFLFDEHYKDGVTTADTGIEMVHSGSSYCDRFAPYGLTIISDGAPEEVVDAMGNGEYLYAQSLPLDIPSRFDGNADEYFGLRTRGGNAMYLGTSLGATHLSHMHFMFHGWIVDKVNIDGQYREIIYR